MSMLEFEEYKGKLNTLKPALDDLQDALHLEEAKREIAELQEESAQDGFWNNVSHSQQVQQRIKQLQKSTTSSARPGTIFSPCVKWRSKRTMLPCLKS